MNWFKRSILALAFALGVTPACSQSTTHFEQFIAGLPPATTPLGNSDYLYVLQGGLNKRVAGSSIVTGVTNNDGTLTFSPTTGTIIGSLNLSHQNTWVAMQTFPNLTLSNITGSTQCLQVNSSGAISGFGSGCGGSGTTISLGATPTVGFTNGNCITSNSGFVGQSSCGSGGGALNITRAQIPSTNTNGASFLATGYAAQGDYGSGAPYICTGQSSSSIGAIQDSTGAWCAIDVAYTKTIGGFRPQWFGAVATGGPDDTAAFQAAIDASFRTNTGQVYCNGLFPISYPLFFDPPHNLRGGATFGAPYFLPSGSYGPGSIVTYDTNGLQYVANTNLNVFGFPPNSPNYSGVGMDLGYQIVNSTASVTYNPTYTNAAAQSDVLAVSFKGTASIGTPVFIAGSGQNGTGGLAYNNDGVTMTTTTTAPIGATIVVAVVAISNGTLGGGGVTDSAGHTYTQVANLNDVYLFATVNIGTALNSGGTITVSGDNYTAVAISVTNATGGVDKTASAHFTTSNSPTVSTGSLGQAVEIVFGVYAETTWTLPGPGVSARGFTEASGFTSATPGLWSLATWNSGTTYSAGSVVYYNGIPWQSLQNANTNNIPTNDLINGDLVWWQPITEAPSTFSENNTLYGPPMLPQAKQSTGWGCIIWPQYNNSAALIMPTGNGNTLDSVYVKGQDTDLGCGQPTTGIGIAVIGVNGGANRTEFRNVGVSGMYFDFAIGLLNIQSPFNGGGTLGAENRIDNSNIDEGCYGVYYASTQAFVNSITNSTIRAIRAVVTNSTLGVHAFNTNMAYEGLTAPRTNFTMAVSGSNATTDASGILFTATLTLAGDPYMIHTCTDPGVPVHFGHFAQDVSTVWQRNGCDRNVYNAWSLKTADYGLIPVEMTAFNPGTGVATFRVLDEWLQNWGGVSGPMGTSNTALLAEIGAQTTIWGTEMTQKFVGAGIDAEEIHVEDDLLPFQLVDSMTAFGQPRATILKNVYFNADLAIGSGYTPGDCPSPCTEARFFATQEFPFIHMTSPTNSGNITLDNLCCTLNNISDNMMVDMAPASGGPNNAQLTIKGGAFGNLNFRYPASRSNVGNFTGYGDNGSAAFGTGNYQVTPWLGFLMSTFGGGSFTIDTDQADRTTSWNSGPYFGVRPAPWTTPCVTASQWATLQGTLPAITNSAFLYTVPYPLLWSGQKYQVCDWKFLAPVAYSGATTYSYGQLVTSSGVTYFSLQDGNMGNMPPDAARWLPYHSGFFSAHGVGFSYGQDLTTTNMPGLTWSEKNNSPFVNLTTSVHVGTLFPGLGVGLAGTQSGCTTQENFIIRELHFTLKYMAVFNADQDVGGNMVPAFSPGSPFVCSNNVIKQAPYAFTNLN